MWLSVRPMDPQAFFNSTARTPSGPASDMERSSLFEAIISSIAAWTSVSTGIH